MFPAPGPVSITVIKLSGSTVFGPREISRTMTVKGLKLLFEKHRSKKLVFGERILEDTETFEQFPNRTLLTVTFSDPILADIDLDEALSHYTVLEHIGAGTYADIFKATLRGEAPPNFVVIKRMAMNSDEGVCCTALREVALLQQCDHPNVIRLREIVHSDRHLYAIMDHLDLDLRAYTKACGPMTSMRLLQNMACMCFRGIEYCHAMRIMHRDIKPSNILVNVETMQVKLADFGLARSFSLPLKQCTHEVVTLWYRAPEILMGAKMYGPAIDIWSMGTVFVEMVTGKAAFQGDSEIGTLFYIFRLLGTPTEDTWPGLYALPDFKPTFPRWKTDGLEKRLAEMAPHMCPDGLQLLMACWTYADATRPSARRCLTFEFFSQVEV